MEDYEPDYSADFLICLMQYQNIRQWYPEAEGFDAYFIAAGTALDPYDWPSVPE